MIFPIVGQRASVPENPQAQINVLGVKEGAKTRKSFSLNKAAVNLLGLECNRTEVIAFGFDNEAEPTQLFMTVVGEDAKHRYSFLVNKSAKGSDAPAHNKLQELPFIGSQAGDTILDIVPVDGSEGVYQLVIPSETADAPVADPVDVPEPATQEEETDDLPWEDVPQAPEVTESNTGTFGL